MISPAAPPLQGLHRLEALTREFRELSFLQRISATAAATRDHAAMLTLIVDETTEVMGVEVCSLYLLEETHGTLVLQATNGLSQHQVGRLRLRRGEGVTGWVAEHRQPLAVEDVSAEPRYKPFPGVDDGFVAMLSVPVIAADRVVGVMNLQTRTRRRFGDHEVEFLRALAGQVAGLIEISHLHAAAQRTVEELNRANRSLVRSSEIHTQFTRLALADRGIEAIAQTLAGLLGERVLVETPHFQPLVAAKPRDDGGRWRRWQPRSLSREILALPEVQRQLEGAVRFNRPVCLGPFPAAGLPHPRTVLSIAAGRQHFGFLSVIHEAPLDEPDGVVAMEQAATVLALEFLKQKVAFEVEERLRGDFVEQLLASESEEDLRRLRAQSAYLGLDLDQPYLVALADLATPQASAGASPKGGCAPASDLRRLRTALDREVQALGGGATVLQHDAVVLLLPDSSASHGAAGASGGGAASLAGAEEGERAVPAPRERPADRLHRGAEAALDGAPVRLVVGDVAVEPRGFRVSYRQARRALETLRRAGRSGVMSAHELGAYQLLLAVSDERLLQEFARRELGALLDYDARNGTFFTPTLDAFLRHNGNFRRTAAELHVHPNTLTYRLRRIREITGIDLQDADRRTALYLATLIIRLPALSGRSAASGASDAGSVARSAPA